MEQIVINITRRMIADLRFKELEIDKANMLNWLNRQYNIALANLEIGESGDWMNGLIVIKQMIDALNYQTV